MSVSTPSRAARRAALVLLAGALPSPAFAVTFRVMADGSGHFATIQAAINAASEGDVVQVGPGTWTGPLLFGGKAVTLRSSDGASATLLDATGYAVAANIGGDATVEGFTIRNTGGGGLAITGGSPTLNDLVFEDVGNAASYGGAINVTQASPVLDGCTFTGGTAAVGGHLYVNGGSVTVRDSTFVGGTASYGGALAVNAGLVTLEGVTLRGNTAGVHGGGVYTAAGTALTATDTTFADNVSSAATTYGYGGGAYIGSDATFAGERVTFSGNGSPDYATTYAYGGGLFLETYSDTTLTDATFEDNLAYYGGGVFQNSAATLDVTGSTLRSNFAYYAAAIWVSYGERLAVTDTVFDTNTAYYGGAGLYVYYATNVSFTGASFTDNLATYGYGAAAMVYYTGQLAVTDTTFDGNAAYYSAGALYLYDIDDTRFSATTFTGNVATYGDGGAIYSAYVPALAVSDSTFDRNEAYYGGGAVWVTGGLEVRGATFTDNLAGSRSGGALYVDGEETWAVRIEDATFTENAAGGDGGAVSVTDAGSFAVTGATFADNEAAQAGGAVYVDGAGSRAVRGSRFAGNLGAYGGGAYVTGAAAPDTWTNTVFQENEASAGGGAVFAGTTATELVNDAFVGNGASDEGAALYLYGAVTDVRNTVFAHQTGAAAVHAYDAPEGLTFAYDDWYANSGGDLAGVLDAAALDATHLAVEPGFVAWSADGDATNDSFVLWRSSALVDRGDPAVQDVDASRSDIGVHGGPAAPFEDLDADGWDSTRDCDDADATVFPGASDAWYDGVDSNCVGNSDHDQDGDGADAVDHGGQDCDDLDGTVVSCDTDTDGAEDTAAVDTDAPAVTPDPEPEGCGCDHGSAMPTLGALLLGVTLVRRKWA